MLRVLLDQCGRAYEIGADYRKGGCGYLKSRLVGFNNAAKGMPYLVLTDLDRQPCPTDLIEDWFGCELSDYHKRRNPNLLLLIAVREVEAWVLADREAFAAFLGIKADQIPSPDLTADPKRLLIDLARKAKNRRIRGASPSGRAASSPGAVQVGTASSVFLNARFQAWTGWIFAGHPRPKRRGVDGRHRLVNDPEQLRPALLSLRRTGENRRQLFEPGRNAPHKSRDVGLHRGSGGLVGLGEDKNERHRVAHQPIHKLNINRLRRQAGIDQDKNQAQVRAVLQVISHGFAELSPGLAPAVGEAVPRQIHQPPALVHGEHVDEPRKPRRGRDAGQPLLSGEQVQQRGLADIGSANKSELRQRLVRTRIQIRRAAVKNGG